jgi:agmatine deiminase
MIPDWETNCVFLAATLEARHPGVFKGLQQALVSHGVEVRLLQNTKDIWVRDFAPIQVTDRTFVKFRYEPDYLRGDHEQWKTGDEVLDSLRQLGTFRHSDIVLDGGNVVVSREKVILTDKVYKENPHVSREQLRRQLQELFQVDQLIVIPKQAYDPIGHSDGVVRFLNEDSVVMNDYTHFDPAYGETVQKVLKRFRLQIELLPHFEERKTVEGIPSAVGNYVNLLYTEKVLVAPQYGADPDEEAVKTLERLLPNRKIVPLECTGLAREGGAFNCATFSCKRVLS